MSAWTDDSKSELRRMWSDGVAAGAIAAALTTAIFHPTKHAVIGAAHRMGLGEHSYKTEHRQQRIVSRRVQTERSRLAQETKAQRILTRAEHDRRQRETCELMKAARNAEKKELTERAAAELLSLPEEKPRRTLMTLGVGECRWPIGEVGEQDFGFCGAAASHGSYCARHAATSASVNQGREAARVARLAMRGFRR